MCVSVFACARDCVCVCVCVSECMCLFVFPFLLIFACAFLLASRQPGEGRRSPPARGDKIKMPTAAAAPRMRRPDDQSAAKLKLPGPPANGAGLMMEVVSTETESSIPPLQTLAQPPPLS